MQADHYRWGGADWGRWKDRAKQKEKKLTGRDNSVVPAGVRGAGGGKGGPEWINGDGQRLDLGWSTHNAVYR